MDISNRLKRICMLADKGNQVADIGCDHAYVSIDLVSRGIFNRALAMDINKGPLEKASENIMKQGLADRITLRLSNGAEKLENDEADCLVIAGMGGQLIRRILNADLGRLKSVNQLILGPQSEIHMVRSFLSENGFIIDKEDMVYEDGKYYQLIHAVRNDGAKNSVSWISTDNAAKNVCANIENESISLFDLYGPCLLFGKHPVLRDYLIFEKNNLETIQKGLIASKSVNDRIKQRLEDINSKLYLNKQAFSYFE